MAGIRIQLKGDLLRVARNRSEGLNHTSIENYIIGLIQKDVSHILSSEKRQGSLIEVKNPAKSQQSHRRGSIQKLRKDLLDGMYSYMKASDDPGYGYVCGYTLKHIDRCAAITNAFLKEISSRPKPTTEQALAIVKQTVLKLNKLNASCDETLIETDQREDLCQLIKLAIVNAGFRVNGDITESWREW